jgi:predicted nucleotidyltransferase
MQSKINPLIRREIDTYKKKLAQEKLKYESVILFGSQAKGTANSSSDIDLCIVSANFGKNRYDERVKLMKMTSGGTINIEPHPYHPLDLANPWDPLAAEIKKYGIVV